MNILVCISRVPDTTTKVNVGADGKSIETQGVKFIVNPYDELALEEGLQLKEKNGGEVTAVTVGTDDNKDVLRTALAMGVDKAVLIKGQADFDSFYAAKNLADYAKELNPDLILLGRQSIDFDSFAMASMLGELTGLPSVSVVSKLDISDSEISAERDIEGGTEFVKTKMPCIISTQKGLNEPRYPKLPDIMKAKKKPIDERDAAATDTKTSILGMELPSRERKNVILGDSDEDINELVKKLHEEAKVI